MRKSGGLTVVAGTSSRGAPARLVRWAVEASAGVPFLQRLPTSGRVLHPSELRSLRSLRTLPQSPSSLLRNNLYLAGPSPQWPRVATSSGCSTTPFSAAAALRRPNPSGPSAERRIRKEVRHFVKIYPYFDILTCPRYAVLQISLAFSAFPRPRRVIYSLIGPATPKKLPLFYRGCWTYV